MTEARAHRSDRDGSGRRDPERSAGGSRVRARLSGGRISLLAAAIVVLLALGALIWPGDADNGMGGVCLVFDPAGGSRQEDLYDPLAAFLADATGRACRCERVATTAELRTRARKGADFVLCPDGLALALDPQQYAPLVTGRRTAPRNLRPRSVLVYREGRSPVGLPWLEAPARTIFGDSVSLCATGILRNRSGGPTRLPDGCASGPDPYDHGPALHALRLGCYDYAVVRQWDAERFIADGLLPPDRWGMEILGGPVPDLVLFASREIPASRRLDLGGTLTQLGRNDGESEAPAVDLERGLRGVHLAGFNLLVEPDLDLVRTSYPGDWLPAAQ